MSNLLNDTDKVVDSGASNSSKVWLPYDQLATSEIGYSPGELSQAIDYSQIDRLWNSIGQNRQLLQSDCSLLAIAATSVLLHRYASSPLQQFSVASYDFDDSSWSNIAFSCSLNNQDSFKRHLELVKEKLEFWKSNVDSLSNQFPLVADNANFQLSVVEVNKTNHVDVDALIDAIPETFDLHLLILTFDNHFEIKTLYNKNCFQLATIENLSKHMKNLLTLNACEDKIENLIILDKLETQWLKEVGTGATYREKNTNIAQRFEMLCEVQPNAAAVQHNEKQLSYIELNQRANQLHHCMEQSSLSQHPRVVVFQAPSVDILVSILAIFKIGGTYIPIDPGFPEERIKIILQDVSPDLIITQNALSKQINVSGIKLIEMDSFEQSFKQYSKENLQSKVDLQQTATIFYTSGTTGKPKGVMASYANINHYVNVARRKYGVCNNDIFPAVARFTFSISLFELLLPISAGGKCLVLDREHILDLDKLADIFQDITFAHIGPSLLKPVVSHMKSQVDRDFSHIRHISSGGDMIPPELIRDLQSLFSNAEVFVIYGCSEISCMGVTNFIEPDEVVQKTFVGKVFENVKMRLLDESFNLVPSGCIGNVCYAGAGIVKGYLNLTELTEQKFFTYEGERFYNTGDRGRLNKEGKLELLGREDFQVQIHGIRIELGEIEYHLRQVAGIKDAVVSQLGVSENDNSLVGYVVLQEGRSVSRQDIRENLLKKLPEYMVPSLYMFLEKLPLNHNLKVDRKALPKFEKIEQKDFVVASTETQKIVLNIWKQLLNIEEISIDSNFNEIGGDSLLLIQLKSKILKGFDINLPISVFFAHPSIRNLSSEIERLLENKSDSVLVRPAFLNVAREQSNCTRDMSFAQQRLWYLEQLAPNTPLYNIPIVIKLSGNIRPQELKDFFKIFSDKHQSLRTSFATNNESTHQQIHEQVSFEIDEFDFREKSELQLQEFLRAETLKPFKLSDLPLFRINWIKIDANEAILSLVIHHIIFDAWSLKILLEDFSLFLDATDDDRIELADNATNKKLQSFQYADYASWQNKWIQQGGVEQQLQVWLKELAGELPILSMPEQKARPKEQSINGATLTVDLNVSLAKRIQQKAQDQGLTPFMVFLAAYFATLYRYTDQKDMIVGTPIANRNIEETESIVGFFVNTLPVRIAINEQESFSELLEKVKIKSLLAFDNQDVPFENLVAEINPTRDPSRTPIFQSIFNYLKVDQVSPTKSGTQFNLIAWDEVVSKTDLSLIVREESDVYKLSLEYCTDIFEQEFINNFLANYELLLESALDDDSQRLDKLPLLSKRQINHLLIDRNQTYLEIAPQQSLLNQFVQNCQNSPNKIAVITDGKEISYQQLLDQVKTVALSLIENGVKTGDIVGLLLARSEKLPITMMAIFYAGASYLPLDPEYPKERIHYILDNAKVSTIVLEKDFSELVTNPTVNLIDIDLVLAQPKFEQDIQPVFVENGLAYVIYTSGSTGNPKGVMITQNNLTNFLLSMQNRPGLSSSDTVLTVTTISFDIAVLEILLPLFVGATTIIVNRLRSYDPSEISQLLIQHNVTLMQATPATWQMLLASNWHGKKDLRALIGGEALPQTLSSSLFSKVSQIWNMYGPTETTVWSTCYQIKSENDVPIIGKPIGNTQVYILDNNLQLVPDGVVGELCIGGLGVTNGYLGEEKLTQEKYIVCPFTKMDPQRIYRTGDQVRYGKNGNIEYIGRIDFQVKVRGYRIELGEIENTIDLMPQIKQSIVMVREDQINDQRIVAYFLKDANQTLDLETLREHMKETLPLYMVPHNFVELQSFPLTPNGKIDRKALPQPDGEKKASSARTIQPTSETEKEVCKIWQELIGEENVGTNSVFFDLGGHSLLALQAISKIKRKFDFELTPLMMIRETVQQIAGRIDGLDISMLDNSDVSVSHEELVPFFFGADNSIFGILHEPCNNQKIVGAVLICNPIYTEEINANRALKRLASQLSQQGYYVLRFDYSGFGDSWGDDGGAGVEQWIADIEYAVNELVEITELNQIDVVALRFGASLVTQTKCKRVNRLILWDPVFDGEKYMEELLVKYRNNIREVNLIRVKPAKIIEHEIVGFHLPNEIRESIIEVKLLEGEGLQNIEQLNVVSSSCKENHDDAKEQLSNLDINLISQFIEEPGPSLESYTNMDAYLPSKSLNVIVDIISGGGR